jgi:hypothetical protein
MHTIYDLIIYLMFISIWIGCAALIFRCLLQIRSLRKGLIKLERKMLSLPKRLEHKH